MALPLILGAIQVAGGIYGGIQGNQQKQKQKGVIGQAYKLGKERLGVRQQDQRAGQAESLVARGLTGGGTRIRRAPVAPVQAQATRPTIDRSRSVIQQALNPTRDPIAGTGTPRLAVSGARTLGQQQQADMAREQQFEQDALLESKRAAEAGLSADATNTLVGNIASGVGGAIQGYAAGKMYNSYAGIDPVDPLGRGQWSNQSVDRLNIYNQSG